MIILFSRYSDICIIQQIFLYLICIADPYSSLDVFTDGLWHSVDVDIVSGASDRIGKINITVDGKSDVSSRQMSFTSGSNFYIGG